MEPVSDATDSTIFETPDAGPTAATEPTADELLTAAGSSAMGRIVPAVGFLGLILVILAILRRRSGSAG